jgi:uncharacterized protein
MTFKSAVAALILAVGFVGSVAAGPHDDWMAAYKRGDYLTAMRLLRPLAEQGEAVAQSSLGMMYEIGGKGVPQDYAAAVSWFRKAAEQDDATAQYHLGVMYENGYGVRLDFIMAHMWLNLAAAKQESEFVATMERNGLAKEMTPAQIAEAQRLAREWKPTRQSSR